MLIISIINPLVFLYILEIVLYLIISGVLQTTKSSRTKVLFQYLFFFSLVSSKIYLYFRPVLYGGALARIGAIAPLGLPKGGYTILGTKLRSS